MATLNERGAVSRPDVLTWIEEIIWRELFQHVLVAFHNRVRMIVASFLIKDLRLDWQSGERYFMRHLLDADVAANNGNWQWCSGRGADAMQSSRIFNPVLQSKRFDGEGRYIRTYAPELAKLPSSLIHEPHMMSLDQQHLFTCRIGKDYPPPLVDHRRARMEYLALAKQAKPRQ